MLMQFIIIKTGAVYRDGSFSNSGIPIIFIGGRTAEITMDYSVSQLPPSDDYIYFAVEYPVEDPDFSGEASLGEFKKEKWWRRE
jgi:hypothetical protein